MRIIGVDHITIRVRPQEVEAMRSFFADLLGLRVGPRRLTFPGIWLYVGDQAVVHVAGNVDPSAEALPDRTSGAIGFDHIAFRSKGLGAAKQRLDQAGIAWREVWRPELNIRQLVLLDPAGTKVELTFDSAEHPERRMAMPVP